MPPRHRLLFGVLNATLFMIAALPLYRELSRRSDIWWTPHTMLIPLTESSERVEIYARGRLLATLLEAGRLRIVEEAGPSVLTAGDVGLRLNNWDRTRAERFPMLLAYAAGCGITATLFLLSITGRLAYHGGKESIAV